MSRLIGAITRQQEGIDPVAGRDAVGLQSFSRVKHHLPKVGGISKSASIL